MIDGSEKSILSLKLILYCFEWLSGLKINFHKSDVYVFGEDQERKEVLANMLNCRLGEWPMKYLGLPIAEHRVGSRAFMGLVDKMRKRLDPWKGRNLSLGGRLVLTNSIFLVYLCIPWDSTYSQNLFIWRWIRLGATSSGRELRRNSGITWPKWTRSVDPKTREVWG